MQDAEGIGEAVTGGALGRAVEPKHGEADSGHTHERNCLNCGCALVGAYCHCCGQRGHVHRTIAAWWHDFVHSVLHLDGKFWLTIPMLAWRPGELTRRYARGERAKFISPLALFLFTVFLMFAVFSAVGGPFGLDADPIRGEVSREARAEMQAELRSLEEERARLQAAGEPTDLIDTQIRFARMASGIVEDAADEGGGRTEIASGVTQGGRRARLTVEETGIAALDKAIGRAIENPELLLYKVQANAYKFSWALIPISVPLVWLLFLHRRRYRQFTGYDHAVFVTYSIAFVSLGLIALSLLRQIGLPENWLFAALLVVPPLHMYRQLRGAYGLSRSSAIWRTILLVSFAFVAIGFFLALLFALGLMG